MPAPQFSPRLARSVCPNIQQHPTNTPKTDKTITKSSKTIHPDRTISCETLGFRPIQRAREISLAKLSTHHPDRRPVRPTPPNKIEQARTPNPAQTATSTTQTPEEQHPRNRDASRQTRTDLNKSEHRKPTKTRTKLCFSVPPRIHDPP